MPKELTPELSPEERFAEVAALLKAGFYRCKRHLRDAASRRDHDSSESLREGLEVSGETRLSGSRGSGG